MRASFFRIPLRNTAFAAALCFGAAASLNAQPKPVPAAAGEKLKWFREAKFGLIVHWGLYSVPAGEWKGQKIPGTADSLMQTLRIPVKEYEQLASQFNPGAFDGEALVKFAEGAGAKYLVVSAKEHDGFAMYDSAASKFNVRAGSPFHRDPLKELADACARHEMKLGVYYSQAQDWHEPNGAGNTWDFGPDEKKNFDQYLRQKAEPQVRELLTKYGPLAVVWFDTPLLMNAARAQPFLDLVHRLQPGALINGRLGAPGDYLSMPDNRAPEGVVKGDWEVPGTVNDTWGFSKYDAGWKTTEQLSFQIADAVSKGGNYLLDLGPTGDGRIPQPAVGIMTSLGHWLKANGDAIFGAGPTPFGDELAGKAWRCTTKPGKLFLHLFSWPATFELTQVKVTVAKAYFLADAKRTPLRFTQQGDRVSIPLPEHPPLDAPLPDRLNPTPFLPAELEHVRVVIALETHN